MSKTQFRIHIRFTFAMIPEVNELPHKQKLFHGVESNPAVFFFIFTSASALPVFIIHDLKWKIFFWGKYSESRSSCGRLPPQWRPERKREKGQLLVFNNFQFENFEYIYISIPIESKILFPKRARCQKVDKIMVFQVYMMSAKGVRDELDELGIEYFGHEPEPVDETDGSVFMYQIRLEVPVRRLYRTLILYWRW